MKKLRDRPQRWCVATLMMPVVYIQAARTRGLVTNFCAMRLQGVRLFGGRVRGDGQGKGAVGATR